MLVRRGGPNKHYELAQDYIHQRDFENAIKEFKISLTITPNHIDTLFDLGNCYISLGDFQNALEWLDKTLRLKPIHKGALYQKAFCLKKLKAFETALQTLDVLINNEPKNENALILKANIFSALDREESAIKMYDLVLNINPYNALARYNKISALNGLGREEEAKTVQAEARVLDRNDEQTLMLKGMKAFNSSDYKTALKLFEEGLKINPNNPTFRKYKQAVADKARLTGQLSGLSGGVGVDSQRITCPKCFKDNKIGANFCRGCGNKLEKIPLQKQVECPSCLKVINNTSNFCTFCGAKIVRPETTIQPETTIDDKEKESLDDIKAKIKEKGITNVQKALLHAKLFYNLINDLESAEDKAKLRQMYKNNFKNKNEFRNVEFLEELYNHYPNDLIILSLLVEYQMKIKNLGQAAVYVKKITKLNPEDDAALNQLGWMCILKGDFDDAFLYLNKAFDLNPEGPEILKNLALAYECIGDKEEAVRLLEEYVEKVPNDPEANKRLSDLEDGSSENLGILEGVKNTVGWGYYLDYSNMEYPGPQGISMVKMVPIRDDEQYQDIKVDKSELVEFRGAKIPQGERDFLVEVEKIMGQKFTLSETSYISIKMSFSVVKNRIIEISLKGPELTHLPENIKNLRSLRQLHISKSNISSLPASIGKLEQLEGLHVTFNKDLTSLPESIGNLKKLEKLYIGHNNITALPESIGGLDSLKILDMALNKIKEIPESFSKLQSIESIDFQSNLLTELPEFIGNLSTLQSLYLFNNKIKRFPDSLANLRSLRNLWAADNLITEFPEALCSLEKLEWIKLEGNPIKNLTWSLLDLPMLKKVDFFKDPLFSQLNHESKELLRKLREKGVELDNP